MNVKSVDVDDATQYPIPSAPPLEHPQCDLNQCAICMDVIKKNDVARLSCSHEFHVSCIMENVLNSNNTCPLCRIVVAKKPPGIPHIGDELIVLLTKETLDETWPTSCKTFLADDVFKNLTKTEKKDIKKKLCYLLSRFGYDMSKNIKKWIERSRPIEEINDRQNEDTRNFVEEYGLEQYAERIYNNDYFSVLDQFLSSTIETFINPPGHDMTEGPYFTRPEAERLMNTIFRYYADSLEQ